MKPTSPRLDEIPANDIFRPVVGPLHQNVGLDQLDQRQGSFLIEQADVVDAFERPQHDRPLGFIVDRPIRSFAETTNAGVGVESDDEQISLISRLLQVADMPPVEDVEAAVGEDNRLSLLTMSTDFFDEDLARDELLSSGSVSGSKVVDDFLGE